MQPNVLNLVTASAAEHVRPEPYDRAFRKRVFPAYQAMMDLKLPDKFKGYTLTAPFGRGGGGGNFVQLYEELKGK